MTDSSRSRPASREADQPRGLHPHRDWPVARPHRGPATRCGGGGGFRARRVTAEAPISIVRLTTPPVNSSAPVQAKGIRRARPPRAMETEASSETQVST